MNERIWVTLPHIHPTQKKEEEKVGLSLEPAVLWNPGSIQLSLIQAKADPTA
jgi:hypothetical protein